jgi:hypothetical protein
MALRHSHINFLKFPFCGFLVGGSVVVAPRAEEDVIQSLSIRVCGCGVDLNILAFLEKPGLRFVPAPGVEFGIARCAVHSQVEVCSGNGHATNDFDFVPSRANGAVRVEDAPDVSDGRVCFYYAMCKGQGDHVEVSEADDEVAAFGRGTHEFCDFPGLCCAVAYVRVVGFAFVGGVELDGVSEVWRWEGE